MTERNYSANAKRTTLFSPISDPTATTIVINDDAATLNYPTTPFTIVVDKGTQSEEIMTVTNVSGQNLTVVRAPEGNAATTHSAGATVAHAVTARDFVDSQTHVYDSASVHGVSGSVVGTTDTQVLTNKTLQNPVLTVTSTAGVSDFTPRGTVTMFAGTSAPNGWLICNGQAVSRATYVALFNVIGTTYGGGDGFTTFQVPNLESRVPVGYKSSDPDFGGSLPGKSGGYRQTQRHVHGVDSTGAHAHGTDSQTGGNSRGHTHTMKNHTHGFSGTTSRFGILAQYVVGLNVATNTSATGGATRVTGASSTNFLDHEHTFSGTSGGPSDNTSDGENQNHTHTVSSTNSAHTHPLQEFPTGGPTDAASPTATNGNLQPYLTLNFIIKY